MNSCTGWYDLLRHSSRGIKASEKFQPADRLFIDLGGNLADLWIHDEFAVSGPYVGFGYLFQL
ncbi:MAG TPA: hypothetical protein VK818_21750 [Methylomirabilota bacterium]|nr:hypothetical protein [Methylomirabilota bacterium]